MAELPAGFSLVDDEPQGQRQSAPAGLPAGFQLVEDEAPQQGAGWATRAQREGSERQAREGEYLADAVRTRQQQDNAGPVGAVDAAVRGAAGWVPGMNKIAAAGDAALGSGRGETFGERYDDNLMRERATDDADRLMNPKARFAGQAAGFGATAALMPGVTVARGAGLGASVANNAATGALYAGTERFVEADGSLAGKATEGAKGAATGAIVGAALGPVIHALTPRGGSAAASPGRFVVEASERLGVPVPRAVATDSMAVQRAAAGARNVPFAGDPLVKAAEGTIAGLGQKADEVATAMGGADRLGAGSTASGGIRDWITGKSAAVVSKAYDDVEKAVNPNVRTDLASTRNVMADILARRQNAQMAGDSRAVAEVAGAVQSPNGLNFQGIKDLRTSIGERLKSGILPDGMDGGELKRIYGALSDDLRQAAEQAGGPRGKQLFERANALNAAVAKRREELAKIVGAKGDASPEQVFDRLVAFASEKGGANANLLAKARNAIAQDWDEVAGGVVSRLGRDADGNFTPDRFVTAWGKLSPQGKSVLFGSSGHRAALEDIATISSRFKELNKFANPSGTAQSATFAATGAGMIASPVTTIASVVGGNILSRILAQPATSSSMARWSRVYQAAVTKPSAATAATLQVATRNLAATIGDKLGVNVAPEAILRAIAGPRMAPASDGQTDQEKQRYRQ
jgi:hypothetical protein